MTRLRLQEYMYGYGPILPANQQCFTNMTSSGLLPNGYSTDSPPYSRRICGLNSRLPYRSYQRPPSRNANPLHCNCGSGNGRAPRPYRRFLGSMLFINELIMSLVSRWICRQPLPQCPPLHRKPPINVRFRRSSRLHSSIFRPHGRAITQALPSKSLCSGWNL
jgi:hypothetical protein